MDSLRTTLSAPIGEARSAVEAALTARGFGVLTEIDLQATFQAKLGVAHEGHLILGVCNPGFAKRALDLDRDVALLLPCTVTLREVAGGTEVRVLDPEVAFQAAAPATRAGLAPLAGEVKGLLEAAIATMQDA